MSSQQGTCKAPAPYGYQPVGHNEIRLLRVSSAKGAELSIDLKVVALPNGPDYTALSYAWEGQVPNQPVLCDDSVLHVTHNVLEFLRYWQTASQAFRPHVIIRLTRTVGAFFRTWFPLVVGYGSDSCDSDGWLWVDAVCINQTDLEEKAHQVQRMGDIYYGASRVVVSLGGSNPKTDQLFTFLSESDNLLVLTVLMTWKGIIGLVGGHRLKEAVSGYYDGLRELSTKPWFGRLWILQEIGLARKAWLRCGQHRASFELVYELARAIDWIRRDMAVGPILPSMLLNLSSELGTFFEVVASYKETASTQQLVQASRRAQCSHPSDKVYGILGLLEQTAPLPLKVDYDLPPFKLYGQFAGALLESQSTLWVLNEALSQENMDGLPTWCPNMNSRELLNSLCESKAYCCATIGDGGERKSVRYSYLDSSIQVRGFAIDQVDAAVDDLWGSEYLLSQDSAIRHLNLEKHALELARSACYKPHSRNIESGSIGSPGAMGGESNEVPEAHLRALAGEFYKTIAGTSHDKSIRRGYDFFIRRLSTVAEGEQKPLGPPPTAEIVGRSLMTYQGIRKQEQDVEVSESAYARAVDWVATGRRYFSTRNGRLGMGPPGIEPGDSVVVLYGGRTPYILRPSREGGYMFVGDTYVDGIMYGETLEARDRRGWEERDFKIL